MPLSDDVLRRVSFGKLEIEIIVDDPKAYTKPWAVKLNHFIVLGHRIDRLHLSRKRKGCSTVDREVIRLSSRMRRHIIPRY